MPAAGPELLAQLKDKFNEIASSMGMNAAAQWAEENQALWETAKKATQEQYSELLSGHTWSDFFSGQFQGQITGLDTGGEVLKTGLAVVHRGETVSPNKVTTIIMNYPTFNGWDDFVQQVRAAGVELEARGMPLSQSAY